MLLWGTDYNRTSLRMTKKESEYTDEDKEAGMKVSAFFKCELESWKNDQFFFYILVRK